MKYSKEQEPFKLCSVKLHNFKRY